MKTGGIILAGGLSTRMGQPKAWLKVEGVTLLERAVALLGGIVSPVIVAAAAEQSLPVNTNVVRDAEPHRGPLQGILNAMETFTECDAAFVMAVDLPDMTATVVKSIINLLQQNPDAMAAVPRVTEQPQPLAACYRMGVLPLIREQLRQDRRAMKDLLRQMNVVWLDDLPAAAFRNLNSPADLS